jgi:nucleoside-diphosphate-sugar epimerase
VKALVIGGTGPTGPHVVDGLIGRGYDVTIVHSGSHEAKFAGPVEDLHGDVHFPETLAELLGDRDFDLVIAQYGRLRVIAEFMCGRTQRFIGIGAILRGERRDPGWGPLGRPVMTSETAGPPDPVTSGLSARIYAARERVLELHRQGHFTATYLGHPETYGPRQHSPTDWSLIRRILDGRRQLVIADGGIKIRQRAYGENCAQAVLLCVDHPQESAGQYFVIGEQPLYTERQRIELVCQLMGHDMELIDLPFDLAVPCHYQWLNGPGHRVHDDTKIRAALGYREAVPIAEAQERTVRWILDNKDQLRSEWEDQMEDTFDYGAEDELIRRWRTARQDLAEVTFRAKVPAHAYRHPRTPGEPWQRPQQESAVSRELSAQKTEYY